MIRIVARIVVGTVYVAVGLYVATGVGLLGPAALAANHALVNRGLNAFMSSGEAYVQAHPIYPVPSAPPAPKAP